MRGGWTYQWRSGQVVAGSEFEEADNKVVSGLEWYVCSNVLGCLLENPVRCHRCTADARGEVIREGPEARVMLHEGGR